MRVVDSRGLYDLKRVCGRRPGHNRVLCPESRQLQTGVDSPELGHHSVDHAR